ncbi:MAG: ceramidase domain-containing protein [Pseudomonadota bacterium]
MDRVEWNRAIDAYCERVGPELWSEPLNAVTNAAFFVAAYLAWRLAGELRRRDAAVVFLVLNLTAIGIGSTLFHTFATRWAAVMDTTPILIFILGYFAVAMRYYIGLSRWQSAGATVALLFGFVGLSTVFNLLLRDLIGGSVSYFPALVMLFAVGGWLSANSHPAGRGLLLAGGIFAVSLTFRALDQPVCGSFPIGTHFMWHVLNGTLLGVLLITLVRHGLDTPLLSRRALAG